MAHRYECSHDADVCFNSSRRLQNSTKHSNSLLCESIRQFSYTAPTWSRKLRLQVIKFIWGQLKHKVFRETFYITFYSSFNLLVSTPYSSAKSRSSITCCPLITRIRDSTLFSTDNCYPSTCSNSFSFAISFGLEYFGKDTTIIGYKQGFSRMFLFEVSNWNLKRYNRMVSKSQFATLKKRVCHKSVTHPFLFFAFSQIRNL